MKILQIFLNYQVDLKRDGGILKTSKKFEANQQLNCPRDIKLVQKHKLKNKKKRQKEKHENWNKGNMNIEKFTIGQIQMRYKNFADSEVQSILPNPWEITEKYGTKLQTVEELFYKPPQTIKLIQKHKFKKKKNGHRRSNQSLEK